MNRARSWTGALIASIALTLTLIEDAAPQVGKSEGIIDLNTATQEELMALPHLNDASVKVITDGRPFMSIVDVNSALLAASLTEAQLAELYGKAFVHVNLNSGSRAEFLLIPGAGERMAHEFEEYRPWRSFAQFNREIGKYVGPEETARLAQYMFIRIDLNTASDEDILSIPGLGQRMLHEFKEYRPYTSMEQFRKEIGKYVGEKEVARLERYVTID
jgi:DNA uptake protein ComE-like DNA-binding protein